MNDTASVILAGLAAFSAFVPPLPQAVTQDVRTVRVGQMYASAATLAVGWLLATKSGNTLPLTMAAFVILLELAAFYHAQTIPRIVNQ